MLDITVNEGRVVALKGRFDASQTAAAEEVFATLKGAIVVDCLELDYISSAGLGVLIALYNRLKESDHRLKITNVNGHIKNVFHYACLDRVFDIE